MWKKIKSSDTFQKIVTGITAIVCWEMYKWLF